MARWNTELRDEDYGAPDHLTIQNPEGEVRKLREGLESGPAIGMTEEDWEEGRRRLLARHPKLKDS